MTTGELAGTEEEADPVSVGCEFVCRPDAAEEVAQALRAAVDEILHLFHRGQILDYGVD